MCLCVCVCVRLQYILTVQCFEVWRQRTLVSLQATQRESEQVQEATKQLSRGESCPCILHHEVRYHLLWGCPTAKQVRVLVCWREHTNSSVARRIGKERAVVHANRALLRRCFAAWHSHHSLSLRKMVSVLFPVHAYRNSRYFLGGKIFVRSEFLASSWKNFRGCGILNHTPVHCGTVLWVKSLWFASQP